MLSLHFVPIVIVFYNNLYCWHLAVAVMQGASFGVSQQQLVPLKHNDTMLPKVKKPCFVHPREKITIAQLIKPLYIILSVFGLFPYSVKFNNKKGLTIIKKSIYLNSLCAVSHILFLTSFLAVHIRYVYDSMSDTTMTREVLTQMNYILELISFQLFCLTAYFCAFTNRSAYVKIINKITKFIEPSNMKMEKEVKRCRYQVNIILVFLVTVFILEICVNFSRDSSFWKTILVCISFLLPQMIQFTVIAFYYVLVLMLIVLLTTVKMHIVNLMKNDIKIMDYFMKAESKISTLQYVESLYSKAFEIKREINEAFQAPLLITTLQCFHAIVSEAHIIYHGLVVERDFSLHSIFNCSIWIIYQIIKIYIISRSGSLLKQEVKRIGQALHDIPTEKDDIRLLLEIQHFTSLMAYQGDDMTAYGLINFDAALLSKITASSAMYLTILVQFDKK